MTWVAAAVMGGSALLGASSSRGAASMQADAAQRASDQQAAQLAQQRSDLQPWRASGEEANNRLRSLMGFDGSNPTASLQSTPGYQFRLGEGQRQVDNSAAARGSTLSGATLKALSRYGQDYASGEYQNQFNRLSGMSTVGQNAAAGQGAASMAFGNSQAQNTIGAGNANAAGNMGAANAFGNAAGQYMNYNQNQNMLNAYYSNKNKPQGYGYIPSNADTVIPMQPGGGY